MVFDFIILMTSSTGPPQTGQTINLQTTTLDYVYSLLNQTKLAKCCCCHRRSQNFWLGGPKPQITCNDVIKKFQKRNFLWDKVVVKWKIGRWGLVLVLNQDFAKGGGLKPKSKTAKMSKVRGTSSKLVLLKCIPNGDLGAKPPVAGRFFVIVWEKNLF